MHGNSRNQRKLSKLETRRQLQSTIEVMKMSDEEENVGQVMGMELQSIRKYTYLIAIEKGRINAIMMVIIGDLKVILGYDR